MPPCHPAFLLALCLGGCAWRTNDAEHFIGPMLFRYTAPPVGKAYVGQVIRFGIAAEMGSTWGLSIGMSERISVFPMISQTGQTKQAEAVPRWTMPFSHAQAPEAEMWNFCLLYCRVEGNPEKFFVARTIHGAEVVVGEEARALSLGIASRTLFTPPDDSISKLHFEQARPLAAEAKVWRAAAEQADLPSELAEEITHEDLR